jgi:hypothetical protein
MSTKNAEIQHILFWFFTHKHEKNVYIKWANLTPSFGDGWLGGLKGVINTVYHSQ